MGTQPTMTSAASPAPDVDDPIVVTVCPNGPLLVRGDVTLLDADGEVIPRNRRTIALCRCGASARAPFCDGSHKVTRRLS
jgi:hypothetical protein